jgi:hypothetical protein
MRLDGAQQMRKTLLFLGPILWSLLAIWLPACAKRDTSFLSALEQSVTAAKKETNLIVTMSSITDFQWDTLFVFGPYTPVDAIHAKLGYKWPEAEKTHIDSSDTFNLLVFVKNGKVVRYFNFPRGISDFPGTGKNVFPWGEDEFAIVPIGTNADGTTRVGFSVKRKKN